MPSTPDHTRQPVTGLAMKGSPKGTSQTAVSNPVPVSTLNTPTLLMHHDLQLAAEPQTLIPSLSNSTCNLSPSPRTHALYSHKPDS